MLILKCNVYLSSPIDFGLQRIWSPKQQGPPNICSPYQSTHFHLAEPFVLHNNCCGNHKCSQISSCRFTLFKKKGFGKS